MQRATSSLVHSDAARNKALSLESRCAILMRIGNSSSGRMKSSPPGLVGQKHRTENCTTGLQQVVPSKTTISQLAPSSPTSGTPRRSSSDSDRFAVAAVRDLDHALSLDTYASKLVRVAKSSVALHTLCLLDAQPKSRLGSCSRRLGHTMWYWAADLQGCISPREAVPIFPARSVVGAHNL